ncbi:hypothetical protein CF165_46535 [Amycolatopsis vastitatis]|uniref:Uncharacterized protein n=1 Tax=Amycolatopsis vastitatis TaxID=1905142 RepID=A0A229SKZ8_9PSEU|nr:hypothetical protein CF165_46535 [Amycolatopsis vastitatis]
MSMSATPLLTIAAVSAFSALMRQVVALLRYRVRRASIERVISRVTPGSRILDRDSDGAVFEITVCDTAAEAGLVYPVDGRDQAT